MTGANVNSVPQPDVSTFLDPHTYVGVVELNRPPNNYLDITLLRAICDALEALDSRPNCRAVVLAASGKHFCAGRDFGKPREPGDGSASIYREAARLVDIRTPVIVAVQGAAIGAGMGLAVWADFRLCSTRAYFAPNFVELGTHHGFGLTATLPWVVGRQRASELLMFGDKVDARRAEAIGLVDRVSEPETLREDALAFAARIAAKAPLAVQSIRATMREGLADAFRDATDHESAVQATLAATSDARETAATGRERRSGRFQGA